MCNITLIDTKEDIINPYYVRLITTTNSLLGNTDGFGYYTFGNDKLVKTKDESAIYWRHHYKEFIKEKQINGIYHVRKASTVTVNGVKEEDDNKSHPFNFGNIILAHNGFLNFRNTHVDAEKYKKDIEGDYIDSQKLAIVLSKICENGKVTFDNIKDSLNLFGGAYCLAIKGKKDNFAWLCRGKDRTLFQINILQNKKPVGILVNTTPLSIILIGEFLLDFGFDYEFSELTENTTYKYNLGSYKLEETGKILQDSVYDAVKVATTPIIYSGYKNNYASEVETSIYEDILDLMYGMGLIITDLIILSELVIGKPIFILDKDEYKAFKVFLEKLNVEAHNSRLVAWDEILKYKDGNMYKLYNNNKIQYPFLLNSKDELKSFLSKIMEEKKVKYELPSIQ